MVFGYAEVCDIAWSNNVSPQLRDTKPRADPHFGGSIYGAAGCPPSYWRRQAWRVRS
jgi:hypothetical protein